MQNIIELRFTHAHSLIETKVNLNLTSVGLTHACQKTWKASVPLLFLLYIPVPHYMASFSGCRATLYCKTEIGRNLGTRFSTHLLTELLYSMIIGSRGQSSGSRGPQWGSSCCVSIARGYPKSQALWDTNMGVRHQSTGMWAE